MVTNTNLIYTRLGSDSHADISCAGSDARILNFLDGRTCTVYPYNDSYKPKKEIKLCDVAFAYDTDDGRTYILRLNQCLDFRNEMKNSLFSTNQVRANRIIVDDVPYTLDVLKRSSQALIIPDSDVEIPFRMHGPIPYIPVRSPTDDELNECPVLVLTSEELWDPESVIDENYNTSSLFTQMNLPDDYLQLSNNIMISGITHSSKGELTPSLLSDMWGISLETAKRTLQVTEQLSVRIPQGSLTRRRRVRYNGRTKRKLGGFLSQFSSDTFMSNVTSLRGNKYVQLFCNKGGYVKSYAMKNKGNAHHAL